MFVVFIGPPGAGKGTQCKRLSHHLGVVHLSTGEIFRQAVQQATSLGKKAAEYIDQGKLVPDELVVGIVTERLGQADCQQGALLDGFPRTTQQASALDAYLDSRRAVLGLVLQLDTPEDELTQRMLQRAEIEKRADDTAETIAKRLDVYRSQTEPLVAYYAQRGILSTIDGLGTPDEVFARIRQCVDSHRG